MSPTKVQPFGRRGGPTNSRPAPAFTDSALRPQQQASALPPDVVAAILQSPDEEALAARPKVQRVAHSLRAAVLAGLVVGILNAALNATSFLSFGGLIDDIPLGQAKLPIAVTLAAAGLFGGARASAFVLIFAQRLLNRLGKTSYFAYMVGGGAASLVYVLIVQTLGLDSAHHPFIIEVLSGMAAGLFYRLFAAAERG